MPNNLKKFYVGFNIRRFEQTKISGFIFHLIFAFQLIFIKTERLMFKIYSFSLLKESMFKLKNALYA